MYCCVGRARKSFLRLGRFKRYRYDFAGGVRCSIKFLMWLLVALTHNSSYAWEIVFLKATKYKTGEWLLYLLYLPYLQYIIYSSLHVIFSRESYPYVEGSKANTTWASLSRSLVLGHVYTRTLIIVFALFLSSRCCRLHEVFLIPALPWGLSDSLFLCHDLGLLFWSFDCFVWFPFCCRWLLSVLYKFLRRRPAAWRGVYHWLISDTGEIVMCLFGAYIIQSSTNIPWASWVSLF